MKVSVTGSGVEASGDVLINGASQSAASNYTYGSEIECSLILDCKTIKEPMQLPVILVNSVGQSEPVMLSVGPKTAEEFTVVPDPQPQPEPELLIIDFAAMTKAEISEHCFSAFDVSLDQSMTKAEMVSEAQRLELEAATAPDPAFADGLGGVPGDLLG